MHPNILTNGIFLPTTQYLVPFKSFLTDCSRNFFLNYILPHPFLHLIIFSILKRLFNAKNTIYVAISVNSFTLSYISFPVSSVNSLCPKQNILRLLNWKTYAFKLFYRFFIQQKIGHTLWLSYPRISPIPCFYFGIIRIFHAPVGCRCNMYA